MNLTSCGPALVLFHLGSNVLSWCRLRVIAELDGSCASPHFPRVAIPPKQPQVSLCSFRCAGSQIPVRHLSLCRLRTGTSSIVQYAILPTVAVFFMSKRGDSTILAGRLHRSKDENHSLHPAPQSRALRPTIQMVRLHNRLKTNVV